MDMVDPRRANARTLMLEAPCAKSRTDNAEPKREKLRMLKEDPRLTNDNKLIELPSRV
jgi:hypothetical protein